MCQKLLNVKKKKKDVKCSFESGVMCFKWLEEKNLSSDVRMTELKS